LDQEIHEEILVGLAGRVLGIQAEEHNIRKRATTVNFSVFQTSQ